MAKNKYKIGDIIFPHYNGTGVWYKRSMWSVVIEIDKKGNWKHLRHWYNCETAELHSMMILKEEN